MHHLLFYLCLFQSILKKEVARRKAATPSAPNVPPAKKGRGRGGAPVRSVLFADDQVPPADEVGPDNDTLFFRIRNRAKEESTKQKQVSFRNTNKRLKLIICNSDF